MKLLTTYCFLFFSVCIGYGQKENLLVKGLPRLPRSEAYRGEMFTPKGIPLGQSVFLRGIIANYANQPIYIYKCYGDSLIFIDSVKTDAQGKFAYSLPFGEGRGGAGIYRINLPTNQWFYILNDPASGGIEIKTLYQFSAFYNIATDSLVVLKSDDNKRFYEFQRIQQKINVANYFLLQMMRLYPLPDPFHKQIEDEYFSRYKAMEQFVKELMTNDRERSDQMTMNDSEANDNRMTAKHNDSEANKVALAYYQPILPDWKQPDPWRDSIIAAHYFDYFNPADSFYLHTNILPEKMDLFLTLSTNKRDAYGQPVKDEMLVATAAQEFLEKTKSNPDKNIGTGKVNFEFCLNYLLKKFSKEHLDNAFLSLYDNNTKPQAGDCESNIVVSETLKEKADKLRNIAIGNIAPDFEISDNLQLSGIQSDYTLLLFWASWCPHCTQVLPEIKNITDSFNLKLQTSNLKRLITVAISLDTNKEQWQKFVTENNLLSFLNFSEFKGWKSEVVKKYNVYATPTMFLLDKDKKIISKPITISELKEQLQLVVE